MLSGWYGVGSGIKAFLDVRKERGLELLRRMFNEARLFRLILDDVERTLLQVDMSIAGEYAELVQDESVRREIFSQVNAEFELTSRMILAVSGGACIGERFPQFRRRLARRLKTINQVSRGTGCICCARTAAAAGTRCARRCFDPSIAQRRASAPPVS